MVVLSEELKIKDFGLDIKIEGSRKSSTPTSLLIYKVCQTCQNN